MNESSTLMLTTEMFANLITLMTLTISRSRMLLLVSYKTSLTAVNLHQASQVSDYYLLVYY